jgi:hypothetical protein
MVYTDEWKGYNKLTENNRAHATVNHTPGQREWARDDDGDGIRKFTTTPWKDCGRHCERFCVPSEGSANTTSTNTSPSFSGSTISKRLYLIP